MVHPNKSRTVNGSKFIVHVIHCDLSGPLTMVSVQIHQKLSIADKSFWIGAEAIDLEKERFWVNAPDPYMETARECLDRLLNRTIFSKTAKNKLWAEFFKVYQAD